MSVEDTAAKRGRRRREHAQRASISYHEGSGVMASVPAWGRRKQFGSWRRWNWAGDMSGIDVMDHLILGDGTYFSFRHEGLV